MTAPIGLRSSCDSGKRRSCRAPAAPHPAFRRPAGSRRRGAGGSHGPRPRPGPGHTRASPMRRQTGCRNSPTAVADASARACASRSSPARWFWISCSSRKGSPVKGSLCPGSTSWSARASAVSRVQHFQPFAHGIGGGFGRIDPQIRRDRRQQLIPPDHQIAVLRPEGGMAGRMAMPHRHAPARRRKVTVSPSRQAGEAEGSERLDRSAKLKGRSLARRSSISAAIPARRQNASACGLARSCTSRTSIRAISHAVRLIHRSAPRSMNQPASPIWSGW